MPARASTSSAPTPLPSATPSRSNSEPLSATFSHNPTEDVRDVDRLTSQIRAFLAASEDVDIDVETVEDLMKAFPDSSRVDEETADVEQDPPETDGLSQSEVDVDIDEGDMELDMSALFSSSEQTVKSWSGQEVRSMMRYLKEHGMQSWVNEYVHLRKHPIVKLLSAFGVDLCPELTTMTEKTMMYFLKVAMSRELRLREKLPQYNTISDAVQLIQSSKRILILTGAGISVSCGIPDFRSRNGLYASLKENGAYDLDDPQQMFDIHYFRENPSVFYSFASQIYPSNFTPSPCHRFIKLVEDAGNLLRNYTQNIDTLETLAGVRNVLQCHGSFATATCIQCRTTVEGSAIEADILKRRVPLCRLCNPPADSQTKLSKPATSSRTSKSKSKKKQRGEWDSDDEDLSDSPQYPPGIMKPDITFFGEKLSSNFDHCLAADRSKVDLLLVIGTSLKVAPVSDILYHLPHSVPQILINKTPIKHINPDIVLLGDADAIVHHLCRKLGWDLPQVSSSPPSTPPSRNEPTNFHPGACGPLTVPNMRFQPPRGNGNLKKRSQPDPPADEEPRRVGQSHVWLFSGAEGGKWLRDFEQAIATPRASNQNAFPKHSNPMTGLKLNSTREAKKQRTR